MKKGIIVWILILAALIGVAMLAKPKVPERHSHQFVASNDCTVFTCTLCGRRQRFDVAQHDYERIDCYTESCTACGHKEALHQPQHTYEQTACYVQTCVHCGAKESNSTHLGWCSSLEVCPTCGENVRSSHHALYHDYQERSTNLSCTKETACTICGLVQSTSHTGNWYYIADSACNKIGICASCGVSEIMGGKLHTWVSENCEEGTACSVCGQPGPSEHVFENGFLRFFGRCTRCDIPLYQTEEFNLSVLLAEILGVLFTAFAFQYAIRRRKYMKINWWLILRTWLNDTIMTGDFRPAVLLKKEAR